MSRESPPLGIAILCVVEVLTTVVDLYTALWSNPGIKFVGAVVGMVLVWGLWTGRSWAWKGAMVLWGLSAVLSFLLALMGSMGALVTTLITVVLMAYLATKRDYYTDDGDSPPANVGKVPNDVRA